MTFKEIEFALEVNGVEKEDIQTLIDYCRSSGIDYTKLDEMLMGMGYDKVFTDEYFGWVDSDDDSYYDDDDTFYSEKIHHPYNKLEM